MNPDNNYTDSSNVSAQFYLDVFGSPPEEGSVEDTNVKMTTPPFSSSDSPKVG